eukprot:Sspe_Gene.43957::Locus_21501_Transcript_1_1_Confidence_1.000_Length_811::g.43957::m.43957
MRNPIDANWGSSGRPSGYSSPGSPSGSPTAKLADAASAVKSKICSDDVKEQLATLTIYASTIIIALAWDVLFKGIFFQAFGENLLWMWLYALVMIILAMAACWWTGESLSFGEDCC